MRVNSILGAILLPAAVGLVLLFIFAEKMPTRPPDAHDRATVRIGDATIEAEIAATDAEQKRGLSGRDSLAPDSGMLFVFETPGTYGFWMKEMRFPLDFIYLRKGTVVAVKENVPVPTVAPLPFAPAEPFDALIEVNAGWIAAHRIQLGDKADIR
jgi:uncharacterized protein